MICLAASVSACGSDPASDGGGGGGASSLSPLLPWGVNNSWTYRVTDANGVTNKVTTVGAQERVGGVGAQKDQLAYKVTTQKGTDLTDKTESYQAPDPAKPDRILRYRELSYGAKTGAVKLEEYWEPARIHVDGSQASVAGTQFVDAYKEYKLPSDGTTPPPEDTRDLWSVISVEESVDVPKGHFDHAVHLQKVGGSTKDYWYVRGVGKVKETGGQTEELVEYTIAQTLNPLK